MSFWRGSARSPPPLLPPKRGGVGAGEEGGGGGGTFRKVNREVTVQSGMQLEDELLARLGQKPPPYPPPQAGEGREGGSVDADGAPAPDFVFYTGCNLLKTPHIALLALYILNSIGVRYQVLDVPTIC